jgi:CheY-like chemotaxis protein
MTAAEGDKSLYCMSCGEDVPIYRVEEVGKAETRCAFCGFTLEKGHSALEGVVECIVLVDDELLFRTLLKDLLIEEQVTKEVIACDSGPAFLTECARRFRDGRPVSLVLLDIVMTPMDGPTAALALRAVERGLDRPAPVPILFISAVRADDSVRRITEACAPALYLNKGKDAAPPRLARRLKELMPHLLSPVRSG